MKSIIAELWATDTVAELFETSGIGFLIVSPDRMILDANRIFCEKIGYTLEELQKKTIVDLTHPDDLAMTHNLFHRVRDTSVPQVIDKRYVTSDGRDLWCKLRTQAVLDESGEMMYRLVMVEDITQAKQNELFLEQMAAIVEASADAIFRTDLDTIIHFWSKGAERLYGYTAEEAVGRSANFLRITDSGGHTGLPEKLLRGEAFKQPHGMTRHKDGHYLTVSVLIFPLTDRHGELVGLAAVHRDISAVKQLEEQIRHSQRMETAGMLAGSIAHDFNNILTVIKGSCEVVAQDLPELAHPGSHLDMIERSADRAAALTRQLLTFSRRQQITPEIFDPNAKLGSLSEMMRRALGEDITLETRLGSSWLIREDPTQLEQIILNLSVNARQAMPDGGRLDIETRDVVRGDEALPLYQGWLGFTPQQIPPGRYVLISVTDTGVGMTQDVLERIFEPFYSSRDKEAGTGLGLSVVYGMIMQAGGGVHVITRKLHGTTFQLYLPAVTKEEFERAERARVQAASRKGFVLVIDKEADVRHVAQNVLSTAGYETVVAAGMEQALRMELTAPIDLIITDIVMQGRSGPELSEYWRDKHPHAKFLFTSSITPDGRHVTRPNSRNLLWKPFTASTLLERVEEVLGRR
ncbi:MAG: PAS domain S-box protein [Pseudomonadota bacterium]|nr:PAS domain S-box protein [Pseudomonadota bacterium]